MTFSFEMPNILAVVCCHLLYMGLGAFWYSPLMFAAPWSRAVGIKPSDVDPKEGSKAMLLGNIPTFIGVATLAVILRFVKADGLGDALALTNLIAVGLLASHLTTMVTFERRSWTWYLISAGYPIVGYNLMAIVLTLWR